jgi:hypothetical protein
MCQNVSFDAISFEFAIFSRFLELLRMFDWGDDARHPDPNSTHALLLSVHAPLIDVWYLGFWLASLQIFDPCLQAPARDDGSAGFNA